MKLYNKHRPKKYRNNKQIVILLGAGFVFPWVKLSSSSIKEAFIKDDTFSINGQTIGEFIFNKLDSFYDYGEANFETFIAAIESMMNYIISSTNIGKSVKNTSFTPVIYDLKETFSEIFKDKNEDEQRIYIHSIYQHFINLVLNKIKEYNKYVLDKKNERINKSLIEFISYLMNKRYSIKIYTTNYDRLIPQILSPHFKVYEALKDKANGNKVFIYDLQRFRKVHLSHFNLHGSIFLDTEIDPVKMKYSVIYNPQAPKYIKALNLDGGNPNEPLLFSPIITGYTKNQRGFSTPFNLGFNAFTNDCNDCRAIITMGYSFSDPHINSILSNFTCWGKSKLVNVTFTDEEFQKTPEGIAFDYEIYDLYKEYEDKTWFHSQKRKIHVYKKGVEDFLLDRVNWKYILE